MANAYFRFKKFTINQDHCAMKVGTDGVLIATWVNVNGIQRILDIGTGTGLIALILAQRTQAEIDAIDIDSEAVKQAKENVLSSPWSDRIHIYNVSLQNFMADDQKYDLIVSNPPYFIQSFKAPDAKRSLARHDHSFPHRILIDASQKLLHPDGRLAVILPAAEYNIFREALCNTGIYENNRLMVYPSPGKEVIRCIGEFSFTDRPFAISKLIIEEKGRHRYSEAFIELTKDFYLSQ